MMILSIVYMVTIITIVVAAIAAAAIYMIDKNAEILEEEDSPAESERVYREPQPLKERGV